MRPLVTTHATLVPSLVAALAGSAFAVPPFPAALGLFSLGGDDGFVINGIDTHDASGFSVSSAGDVNGDGYDDLLIGAPWADPNGQSFAGESYVVFGKPSGFAASLNLSTLNGTNGFVVNGIDANDYSGVSVSSAGDVNGDGYDDLLIGAYLAGAISNRGAGESYVVFGKPSGFAASLNLSTLNGANGFAVNGIDAYDNSGRSVSSAGDVNGDGYDDLLIGAPWADPNGQSYAGESYVVFGRAPVACAGDVNGNLSTNISDFSILAAYFGSPVAPNTNGDLSGDGLVNISDFSILAGDFGCGS